MYHLIKQPEEQLRILFRNTAQKTGLHEAIVEKDFWVCLWTISFITARGKKRLHSKVEPACQNATA